MQVTKISMSDLGKVIKKYFLLLLLIPIATTALVFVAEKVILPQEYTASTQLLLTMDTGKKNEQTQTFDDLRSSIQLIGTFSTTIQSAKVRNEVAKELGQDKLDETISVITDQNSLYFTVNVTGTDAKQTMKVADTLGKVLKRDFPKLFAGINVNIMESADSVTVKPITFQLLLGFLIGVMASLILTLSLLIFSSIVTKESQLRDLGLTVLGDVPWKNLRREDFETNAK